jgi:hypothetical protein
VGVRLESVELRFDCENEPFSSEKMVSSESRFDFETAPLVNYCFDWTESHSAPFVQFEQTIWLEHFVKHWSSDLVALLI